MPTPLFVPGVRRTAVRPLRTPRASAAPAPRILRKNTQTAESASATVLTPAKPNDLADGDVIWAAISAADAITITKPSAPWVEVGQIQAGGATCTVGLFYLPVSNAAGEPATYTWTISAAGRFSISLTGYSGVDPITIEDVTHTSAFDGGAPSSLVIPSLSTVTDAAMLISACANNSAGTALTPPATMGQVFQSTGTGKRLAVADENRPTLGATGTRTWTTTTLAMAGILAAMRPTTGGGAAVNVDGNLAVTATIDGTAAVDRTVAGDRPTTAAITGTAAVDRTVAGNHSTTATIAGTIDVVHPGVDVDGALAVTATISGSANAARTVQGDLTVTATRTGTANVDRAVAGSQAVTATITGAATAAHTVAGDRPVTATISGTIDVIQPGQVNVDGARPVTATITGTVAATRTIDGALAVTATISGSINKTAAVAGNLQAQALITGSVDVAGAYIPMRSHMDVDLDTLTGLHGGTDASRTGTTSVDSDSSLHEGSSTASSGTSAEQGTSSGAVS